MPARNEKLYFDTGEGGERDQVMDFPLWWDRSGFFLRYGDRKVDTGNPFYVDYEILLTPEEVLEWDRECRKKFRRDPSSRKPHIVAAMEELQAAAEKARWVVVKSYEWESGLD